MNEKLNKLKEIIKKPKILIAVGVLGIALIFLSSFITGSEGESKTNEKPQTTAADYKAEITKSVKQIVKSVSGDNSPTVVITLESGIRYVYADSGESDSVSTSGNNSTQESESSKRSYVTVRDGDGGESALVVTESMPEIRGVAVVCKNGDNEIISEKIKCAVTAALNINSKRVYISGGNGNEEN